MIIDMLQIEFNDGETMYYVYTNVGHSLVLVTRNGTLATQINAALKNQENDSEFRILVKSKKSR